MLEMDVVTFVQCFLSFSFCYCVIDLLAAKRQIRKRPELPVIGSPSTLVPWTILNFNFATNAAQLVENGYTKVGLACVSNILILTHVQFKDQAYQLIRSDGSWVVLPQSLLGELSALPSSIASPSAALENDLLGPLTGLNLISETRLHQSIVQRKLTPRLGKITSGLEHELKSAFDEYFPSCNDWVEFKPYQLFGKVSARLSGRALVGSDLCRNATWLDISFNYTESCM